jgi:hypothetical protein
MARHTFGQSPADWTFTAGPGDAAILAGGVTVTFFNAASGGTQYTDLLDSTGSPVSGIVSGDGITLALGTIPQFQGPDGVAELWADAGGGTRYILVATDLSDLAADVDANTSAIGTLSTTVSALAPVASSGAYSDLTGAPVLATVATSGKYTDLTSAPPPGLQIVAKVGGSWPTRATTAPDATRLAMWVGPSPAPPAGSGYALAGDLWTATPA